jgi:hypothetical protein
MVDEPPPVGLAHAFLGRGNLPFIEFDELPDGFGRKGSAAAPGCLGELVEALAYVGLQPQGHKFTHADPLYAMNTFSARSAGMSNWRETVVCPRFPSRFPSEDRIGAIEGVWLLNNWHRCLATCRETNCFDSVSN